MLCLQGSWAALTAGHGDGRGARDVAGLGAAEGNKITLRCFSSSRVLLLLM